MGGFDGGMTPPIIHPNGRCCIIENDAGQQIAKCKIKGLSQASIDAARKCADAKADAADYEGERRYVETEVAMP